MAGKGKAENPQVSEQDYLNNRLLDQLNWYDRKSIQNQKRFKKIRTYEIILGAMIPFLLAFGDVDIRVGNRTVDIIAVIVAGIGVAIVILGGMLALNKYEENYINYRKFAETLKSEKWRYQTRSQPYNSAQRFNNLVMKVEKILADEHQAWTEYQSEDDEDQSSSNAAYHGQATQQGGTFTTRVSTTASSTSTTTSADQPEDLDIVFDEPIIPEEEEDTPPDIFG